MIRERLAVSDFYMDYMDVYQWQGCSGYVHIPADMRFMCDDYGSLFPVRFCAAEWEEGQLFYPL